MMGLPLIGNTVDCVSACIVESSPGSSTPFLKVIQS